MPRQVAVRIPEIGDKPAGLSVRQADVRRLHRVQEFQASDLLSAEAVAEREVGLLVYLPDRTHAFPKRELR